MSYVKRTCRECGYKDIQPNMYRSSIRYKSGSSNTGITKRTLFSSLLGSPEGNRQLGKYLFFPNKRDYYRNREIWLCTNCALDAGIIKLKKGFWGNLVDKAQQFIWFIVKWSFITFLAILNAGLLGWLD